MKCSETWLREWVNPELNLQALCDKLTMGGLEVEEVIAVAENFKQVVIGQVITVDKHPDADRLRVCTVNVGAEKLLTIVCGADNVRPMIKVPVALVDAQLPKNLIIAPTTIRGVASEGMLCSASELGLTEESQGLLILPTDAPIGVDLRTYLTLNDYVIDISITPNRGDCLSIRGIAREIAALTNASLNSHPIPEIKSSSQDKLPITLIAEKACPRYVGRIIKNVVADAETPIWMQERLRRAGIRRISPIVDVTNYVMLELGQPMHAFDLNKINAEIIVRHAKKGEHIALLDGSEQKLTDDTLVIADKEKPLAIAGVMGGIDSSVTLSTHDIFLESAYFSPQSVAFSRQHYQLNSDSAYRFERGIDYTMQREAVERATALILEIAGGEAGPITEMTSTDLPKTRVIQLAKQKTAETLGVTISDQQIESIWSLLNFDWKKISNGWEIKVPAYRHDITLPQDLIEEVARLFGYDNIPTHTLKADLCINPLDVSIQNLETLRQGLSNQGFHEIVSYSFIDKKLQTLLNPEEKHLELLNPISAEMAVMRTSLWPGLINTLLYNKSRQQQRVRLFEVGLCFKQEANTLSQIPMLAGVVSGSVLDEQWGSATKSTDFFDLKSCINNVLSKILKPETYIFLSDKHAALHPGQTAAISFQDKKIGMIGLLHPTIAQALDLEDKTYVFELSLNYLNALPHKQFKEWSKFPEIRRDIALLVNQTIPSKDIQDTIKIVAGDWLKNIFIFDVYQGKGIAPGQKSIALALILQHPSRTLVDEEVAELMEQVIAALKGQLGAELRS